MWCQSGMCVAIWPCQRSNFTIQAIFIGRMEKMVADLHHSARKYNLAFYESIIFNYYFFYIIFCFWFNYVVCEFFPKYFLYLPWIVCWEVVITIKYKIKFTFIFSF